MSLSKLILQYDTTIINLYQKLQYEAQIINKFENLHDATILNGKTQLPLFIVVA